MHYIKDIFEKNVTEHAHEKFVRYSKGNFIGPLSAIRFAPSQIKFSGSFHYVDELLYILADILGNQEIHVKGSLVWNRDLGPDLAKLGIKYSKVTKSRGIFKYVLENNVRFKDFIDSMGKYHLLINFKTDDISYVVKPSFPKPNKEFSKDFCKVSFPGKYKDLILDEFVFDVDEKKIKKVLIKHEIDVNEIELPNIDNFEEARKLAKRIGKIRRFVTVDSLDEVMTQRDFRA